VDPKNRRIVRAKRVARTDQAILGATVEVLNGSGYSELSFNAIARAAAISTATVAKRFTAVSESAAAAWRDHYGAIANHDLRALLDAAGLLESTGDAEALVDALRGFATPSRDWRSIGELLIVASFEAPLRDALRGDLQPTIAAWCTPSDRVTLTLATQRVFLLTLALGLTLIGAHPGLEAGEVAAVFERLHHALHHPSAVSATPNLIEAMPLEDDAFDFETDDAGERELFHAILSVVAERGVDRATTQAIARAFNSNESFLFSRYPSKIEAFLEAVSQHQRILIQKQNRAALSLGSRYPQPIVDAAVMQRSLHPARSASRTVAMEYLRMVRYHPRIAEHLADTQRALHEQIRSANPSLASDTVNGWLYYGLALGAGLGLLPLLLPDAGTLPFQVVLEPMISG